MLLSLQERSAVEAAFGAGRVRVVVATCAFGMGVDVARVQAVVHAGMPRSLEEYVQQVGACRGEPAASVRMAQ
jgi:superfamily II DNA helicase RecQ